MSHINLFLYPCPYLHGQWDIQHLQRGQSEARQGQEVALPAFLLLIAGALTHQVHPSDNLFKLVGPSHQSTASSLEKERWHREDFAPESPCTKKQPSA